MIINNIPNKGGSGGNSLYYSNLVLKAASFVTFTAENAEEQKLIDDGYIYRASLSVEGIQENMTPEMVLSTSDIADANADISNLCRCYNGGVYSYSKKVPTKDIAVLTLKVSWNDIDTGVINMITPETIGAAINTALAQAKASGEFDGEDGTSATHSWNGTVLTVTSASGTSSADLKGAKGGKGDKGDTGATGSAGKDGTSVTHSWSGTTLTVTSASGTTSANLKGDKGDKGDTGGTGAAGTSVTVKYVSESTADGGSNVVTFSDGKTLTVKNGSKGSTGTAGKNGADGKTPVKGVDFWTAADQEAIVQDVIAALGTPVFGRVDADNNIILIGELTNGTYTLKYENADGTKVEIGIVELGGGDVVVDESGPIALTMVYGVKLDKNTGAEGSGTGYAASQSIPYDSAYEYTMATTNDKHAYGAACWYDASGSYLGWNDIIATGTSGVTNSGVLEPLAGASTFRLRIVALNSGDESRISLRKDLIQ